jgi:CHAT domain-containing protein
LVPFPILRSGDDDGEYLSEKCSLLTVPSLHTLRQKSKIKARDQTDSLNSSLVVGGPRIPVSLSENCGWTESPAALQEAEAAMVADMLQAKVLVRSNATKESVISELHTAECVHFACNLSWKLGAVVLSPGEELEPQSKRFYNNNPNETENDDESSDISSNNQENPPLSDFVLSANDLMSVKMNAKLMVLSSYHSMERITGTGVAHLAGSWLVAGCGAILVSLWPVPETAAKILLRAFYSALLQGSRVATALSEAMQTVQHTKHFCHPQNWAGFLLIGGNVRLSNKVALIGQALCELMRSPNKCRDVSYLQVQMKIFRKLTQNSFTGVPSLLTFGGEEFATDFERSKKRDVHDPEEHREQGGSDQWMEGSANGKVLKIYRQIEI